MIICLTQPAYSVAQHDDLVRQWLACANESGPLQLDLRAVESMDPFALCALVLFINHLPESALPVKLLLPGWPPAGDYISTKPSEQKNLEKLPGGVVSYLTRMGFWELVGDRLDCRRAQLPVWPADAPESNVLLDLTVMHSHDAISVMLRKTGDLLQEIGYSIVGRGHVLEVLSELCSNVLMHAQAEFGGVAAMQTHPNKSGVRCLVVGIGDAGIGVRASLAANQKLAARLSDDAQALGVAVQAGASRFATIGHGGGLPRVLEIAKRYGGRVAIRSGAGALAYNGEDGERRSFEAPPLPGTYLRILLPEAGLLKG